ncbi:MAG TPA: GNAT family N-acetyltransferase [Acidimicrobiia bacterium]
MPEIQTREATADDLDQILAVLRAALGETPLLKRTREQWSWKHEQNPFGSSIVLVATSGGRIAGVRALMRWRLSAPGLQEVSCVRPVDTATHPDFERQGIFRRLTMESLELAREQGVQLVFNTPNARSGAGYLSMGWKEVGPIGAMVRVRVGRVTGSTHGSAPQLAEIAPGSRSFSPIAHPDRPPRGLRTVRSRQYQDWRFCGHPTVRYGTIGPGPGTPVLRAGVRNNRPELVISDLLGEAVPADVRLAGRANRSRYMAGFFAHGSPERRTALMGGMIPVPGIKALQLVALPLTDIDIDVFDLGCWDIATSDLELL